MQVSVENFQNCGANLESSLSPGKTWGCPFPATSDSRLPSVRQIDRLDRHRPLVHEETDSRRESVEYYATEFIRLTIDVQNLIHSRHIYAY